MIIVEAAGQALAAAFNMLWEVLWPLALGFILSAIVQTLVSRTAVARALGSDSPRSLAAATVLGAASSSCSYAAVAIARSLFRKGASFPAAIVFEQRDHLGIAALVGAVCRRARGPYARIRISGALQQQARHLDAVQDHCLKQRAASRPVLLGDVADLGALVRIETEV